MQCMQRAKQLATYCYQLTQGYKTRQELNRMKHIITDQMTSIKGEFEKRLRVI